MRGEDKRQSQMLCLINPADRIPKDHPLRKIRVLCDKALERMAPLFDEMYSHTGKPSIPPEWLLKGSLLMALYSIRSERQFCEQLDYNVLFRWFLGMDLVQPAFDHSTFSKNRERLLHHDAAGEFFSEVVRQCRESGLMSAEHFTVDGTLIEAWASVKSFRRRDQDPTDRTPPDDPGNPTVDFHGEKRSNTTHSSTTDPQARLAKKGKGKEAKLAFSAHALMENRNGLLVDLRVCEASGTAEREAAIAMLDDNNIPGAGRATLGADKGYDTHNLVDELRSRHITPHIARNDKRKGGSALDGRTTRHVGYAISQRMRKRVEEIFGWAKTTGGLRKTRFRGVARTGLYAFIVGAAYNLVRMIKLLAPPGPTLA
ncbi:MAG: IS5 family transposase [Pseudomonadota bacterium]